MIMVKNAVHFTFFITLRKKCPYWELFSAVFSRIRTEYSVRMWENTDQNNSEYGHFSRSVKLYQEKMMRWLTYLTTN